ncbi:MAG: DUF2029 domain-containing protein [Chloroflexi bacterium]|nr:DUF2029 domain-containing protein [Chloroflexota bacterium]
MSRSSSVEPSAAVGSDGHHSLMGARGRWANAGALWLAALGAVFLVASMAVLVGSPGWGYDFEAYYVAALRLARGDGVYQPWTLAEAFRPGPYGLYLYAPPLAIAFLPLTALSLSTATALWVAVRIVLLGVACALMPVSRPIRLATFAAAAFSSAVLSDLHLGNVSVVVACLSVFVWRWLDRPQGSAALALCLSVRPTMGLVCVSWLLRRRLRPVIWTAIAGVALVAITLPFVGLQGYRDYLTVLSHVSEVTGVANNLDLGSTVLRMGGAPIAATVALFLGYAVGIGAMLLSLRRDRELNYVVTLGASLLLAPLLWDHYLASLIIPAAFLAQRGRSWGVLLPLLAWAPPPLLSLLVVASTVLPFLAHDPIALARDPDDSPPAKKRAPSGAVPVPEPVPATWT